MKRIVIFFKKIKEKIKGFTLVELLAVIVILAIIMLIAIPTVLNTLEIARKKAFMEYVDKTIGLAEQKYLEGTITGDLKNLIDVPVKNVVNTEDFLKAIASRLA